jgi:hypothetical protein
MEAEKLSLEAFDLVTYAEEKLFAIKINLSSFAFLCSGEINDRKEVEADIVETFKERCKERLRMLYGSHIVESAIVSAFKGTSITGTTKSRNAFLRQLLDLDSWVTELVFVFGHEGQFDEVFPSEKVNSSKGRLIQKLYPIVMKGSSSPTKAILSLGNYRVVTGSAKGKLRLWDTNTKKLLRTFSGHQVNHLSWNGQLSEICQWL